MTPAKKLEDTLRLSELVIEVLQQNEEHHAEVRSMSTSIHMLAHTTHTASGCCLFETSEKVLWSATQHKTLETRHK